MSTAITSRRAASSVAVSSPGPQPNSSTGDPAARSAMSGSQRSSQVSCDIHLRSRLTFDMNKRPTAAKRAFGTSARWKGQASLFRKRQTVLTQERQFVPVSTLEHDLVGNDVEEAAAAQAQRIPPLEYGPLTVFKDVLDDAYHLGRGEPVREHPTNRGAPAYRCFGDLVVYRIFGVEGSQTISVGGVE